MKKLIALFLLLAVLLTGCSNQKSMTIQTAELTKAEENIKKLLGNAHGCEYIFDFRLDDKVKSIQINTYALEDGAWKLTSGGGGQSLDKKSGRLALKFETLGQELRTAIQTGDEISASEFRSPEALENHGSTATGAMPYAVIEYGKEIPLVMQVNTSQNAIRTLDPEGAFRNPAELAGYGYERVCLLTVMFSTEGLE